MKKAAQKTARVKQVNPYLALMEESLDELYSRPERLIPSKKNRLDALHTLMSSGEERHTSETGGEKGRKAERLGLLPYSSLAQISRAYAFGAAKYSDHNWRKGYPWGWSYDALQRHLGAFWDGENNDPESGLNHLAHAGWHILTLLWFFDHMPQNDDRYRSKNAYQAWVSFKG